MYNIVLWPERDREKKRINFHQKPKKKNLRLLRNLLEEKKEHFVLEKSSFARKNSNFIEIQWKISVLEKSKCEKLNFSKRKEKKKMWKFVNFETQNCSKVKILTFFQNSDFNPNSENIKLDF